MTLRRTLALYLGITHLLAAGAGAALLWRENRGWILALEVAVLCSVLVGLSLLRSLKMPTDLVAIGREWINEGDFSHSVKPVGTTDLKQLIELFNSMFERLRGERLRLREQNLFLDKVMEASPSGILTTDHDGLVDLVNPAAVHLLDADSDEIRGRPINDVLSETRDLEAGQSRSLSRAGGRRLRLRHAEFFDRGFPRSLYLVEDLTPELWAGEKRAYHTLIRTMTHEVNNTLGATGSILRSVLAYSVQLAPEDRQDFSDALTVARQRGEHLVAFMKRYAEVVKVPPPKRRPVEVEGVLLQMKRLFAPQCAGRGIDLQLDSCTGPVIASIDPVQIEQVLVNVLQNAIEAVEHDGRIDIRLSRGGSGPVVEIIDSGPGLEADARDQLFTPFFTTKADGQGVGLTIVREILTLHGADFSLDAPTGGPTCFRMGLPA